MNDILIILGISKKKAISVIKDERIYDTRKSIQYINRLLSSTFFFYFSNFSLYQFINKSCNTPRVFLSVYLQIANCNRTMHVPHRVEDISLWT